MLEAPRELADRALDPLKPLGLPPNPLALGRLLDGMLRLPIWSLPPRLAVLGAALAARLEALGLADLLEALGLAARLEVEGLAARLEAPGLAARLAVPALAPPERLPLAPC